MVGDGGETPDDVSESELERLDLGEAVYDSDGTQLGTIRGFDEGGFYVTMREGMEALSVEHARVGQEFGEGYLMWRCTECGEMGSIDDGLPDECPNCSSPKEDLYYWTED
ncbi:hypothetical protein AUR64_01440 [Haloprofundus marisrubri]|uniref:DUF7130 domain-containing protein n=1 Tax=Haloprofundus marisrubri TaxID=1514971 RepID=A0A0W1R3K8_9EURY|nr:hypothetical protein [Haloprofundus marisrubri]KTG07926.1 hypothetical protein AUR64_01440 [Haloprofundus marisrubri]